MRTFTPLIALLSAACLLARASPVDTAQTGADDVQAVARSMMGTSNNLVSWDSQPLERSPADPEQEASELEKRIVYNPPVTHPTTGTVWHAGRKETVTWDVIDDQIPAQAKNFKATIKLGYMPKNGNGGLNLKWTLARDIPITEQEADIVLPKDLESRKDYIIVVMGDSGNRSKKFTIRKKDDATEAVTCDSKPTEAKADKSNQQSRDLPGSTEDVFAEHMLGRDVQKSS